VLGRSGLRVSPLGFGLAAVGRPAYINIGHDEALGPDRSVEALRARAEELLDAAYGAGVRYFDAARSYGRAEEFLGGWLRRRRLAPGDVAVGSKWGYTYTGGWRVDAERHEVKDLSAGTLRRQLEETRALLGDHLGAYQIHSATLESGVLSDQGVMDELAELRASGVAVGVTLTGPRQADAAERVVASGAFDAIQATWNVLERSAGPALGRAHAAGLGIIVKEVLANGRLTADGGFERLAGAAQELGTTPDALAIAAALAQPWADVVLSGAATRAQLESNLAAEAVRYGPAIEARLAGLAEDSEAYWARRSAFPWT
jgi:aryl-alcohol dehydrogenase-like predicted oxidoreductase